mmetsp:Transcript_59450/g.166042  ORF Transcript_59450/g.166042 Transcript_59450/m.166042 type:complete len:145 (-) Transcript_59450:97-531(-)
MPPSHKCVSPHSAIPPIGRRLLKPSEAPPRRQLSAVERSRGAADVWVPVAAMAAEGTLEAAGLKNLALGKRYPVESAMHMATAHRPMAVAAAETLEGLVAIAEKLGQIGACQPSERMLAPPLGGKMQSLPWGRMLERRPASSMP